MADIGNDVMSPWRKLLSVSTTAQDADSESRPSVPCLLHVMKGVANHRHLIWLEACELCKPANHVTRRFGPGYGVRSNDGVEIIAEAQMSQLTERGEMADRPRHV